jgi:hypothetical protein
MAWHRIQIAAGFLVAVCLAVSQTRLLKRSSWISSSSSNRSPAALHCWTTTTTPSSIYFINGAGLRDDMLKARCIVVRAVVLRLARNYLLQLRSGFYISSLLVIDAAQCVPGRSMAQCLPKRLLGSDLVAGKKLSLSQRDENGFPLWAYPKSLF